MASCPQCRNEMQKFCVPCRARVIEMANIDLDAARKEYRRALEAHNGAVEEAQKLYGAGESNGVKLLVDANREVRRATMRLIKALSNYHKTVHDLRASPSSSRRLMR
jgi:hypothetical protein